MSKKDLEEINKYIPKELIPMQGIELLVSKDGKIVNFDCYSFKDNVRIVEYLFRNKKMDKCYLCDDYGQEYLFVSKVVWDLSHPKRGLFQNSSTKEIFNVGDDYMFDNEEDYFYIYEKCKDWLDE